MRKKHIIELYNSLTPFMDTNSDEYKTIISSFDECIKQNSGNDETGTGIVLFTDRNVVVCGDCGWIGTIEDYLKSGECPKCKNRREEKYSYRQKSGLKMFIECVEQYVFARYISLERNIRVDGIHYSIQETAIIFDEKENSSAILYNNGENISYVKTIPYFNGGYVIDNTFCSDTASEKCKEYVSLATNGCNISVMQYNRSATALSPLNFYEKLSNIISSKVQKECCDVDTKLFVDFPTDDELVNECDGSITVFKTEPKTVLSNGTIRKLEFICPYCGEKNETIDDEARFSYRSKKFECQKCGNKFFESNSSSSNYFYHVDIVEPEDSQSVLLRYINYSAYKCYISNEAKLKTFITTNHVYYVSCDMCGVSKLFNISGKQIKNDEYTTIADGVIVNGETIEKIKNLKQVQRTGYIQYSDSEGYGLKFFIAAQKCGYTEIFAKSGLFGTVRSIINTDMSTLPKYIQDRTKSGMYKFSKSQIENLSGNNIDIKSFATYVQCCKKDSTAMYSDFEYIAAGSNTRFTIGILRLGIPDMTLQKIAAYILNVDESQCCPPCESVQLWMDYLSMLKLIDADLTVHNLIYPKALKTEHDKASRKASQISDYHLNEQFDSQVEKASNVQWENENYKFVLLDKIDKVHEEGRKMSHCVGSYANKIARGGCIILSLRNKVSVEKPLLTVEVGELKYDESGKVKRGSVLQARGFANRVPTFSEKNILADFAKKNNFTLDY